MTAHSAIPGNEYADYKAKEAALIGSLTHQHQICTPAGIRQHFRTNRLTKQVRTCNWNALRALVYLETDKGPLKYWLHRIGRAENNKCPCPGNIPQNAAHICQCKEVGDGKGWTKDEAEGDEGWCDAVLRRNTV